MVSLQLYPYVYQTVKICSLAAHRWGDLAYALGAWSNERKDGPLDKCSPKTVMVSATIKFAIATGWLQDRSNEGGDELEEVSSADEEDGV